MLLVNGLVVVLLEFLHVPEDPRLLVATDRLGGAGSRRNKQLKLVLVITVPDALRPVLLLASCLIVKEHQLVQDPLAHVLPVGGVRGLDQIGVTD